MRTAFRSTVQWGLATASAVLAASCIDLTNPGDGNGPAPDGPPVLNVSTFLDGLSSPWDLAFHTDGTMFFTEKCLGLSVRHPNGDVERLFGAGGALAAPDLVCEGQAGMNGVALDPAFATNRRIYVFMAADNGASPRTNKVVRLELDAGFTTASNRTDIITDIPYKQVANAVGAAGAHNGGRIRFSEDGYLWVTTGDNHNPVAPQSPTLIAGKVLRVTTDGAAAPGNAPPPSFDLRIYSYGHRNVQGIAFRPNTTQYFIAEHGPNHTDEVTLLTNGGNGGWDPRDRPLLDCPHDYCGYAGNEVTMPMTDLVRFPTAMVPIWVNEGFSQGLGPATFVLGDEWLAFDGDLFLGVMGGQRLIVLTLNHGGLAIEIDEPSLPGARYRSLVQGPDGALYIATDAGAIWRVTPSPAP